jgi:Flp pilus assembly protein TadG
MRRNSRCTPRRGSILPLLAFSLIGLCGFVALAVDLGMLMVAKTQAQNAADAAALAGSRTLDGSTSGNVTAATTNARNTAKANKIMTQQIQDADVTLIQHGAYHYDPSTQTFSPQFPPVSPDNYNLTQVTVTKSNGTAFARVLNLSAFTVQATSIAAHRPRDVTIVLDYSGSMNNESDLWNCETYLGSMINTSNNTDTVFPQFGPYSPSFSPLAALQCTSSDPRVGFCNVTTTVQGVPPLADDFYQNVRGAPAIQAFAPPPVSQVNNTTPGGDNYLPKKGTTTPALTCADITGSSSTAFNGYAAATGKPFNGWTQGPGYWGKTFYIWPPDPTYDSSGNPWDWRKKFFFASDGKTPLNDNTKLFGSNGIMNPPMSGSTVNYVINYKAILAWISANCMQKSALDGNPFPQMLRAGGILYYNSIPTDVPASAYTWNNSNDLITDPTQRFWKEYIDYTLGVWHDPFGNLQGPATPSCSYGGDYTAGSSTAGQYVAISGPSSSYKDAKGNAWISATDNPKRPRHRFWFGPMTMIQYMSDTGLLPGTTHDVSMISAKTGIQGALTDIQTNYPNDLVSLLLFSRPHYQGEPVEVGQFSQAVTSLSRDYTGMINSLYFAPGATTADITPWSAADAYTPRAHGDYDANTATSYGFMLAYNQLSSSSTLRSQAVGGYGRKGARRLIILETDGMANQASGATFTSSVSGSTNNSYYNILPGDTVTASGSSASTDAINVVTKLVAQTTDMKNGPGFATPNVPVTIHCIAFGAIFEPTASGAEATNAMSLLQQISALGGTGFPSSVTDTSSPYFYKLCVGNLSQRQALLQQAFNIIMADGASVVLVQ